MTIRKRLIFTLGVALRALFVVGRFGLWRLSQAQQRFALVQTNIIILSTKELNDAKDNVSNLRRLAYSYLFSRPRPPREVEQLLASWRSMASKRPDSLFMTRANPAVAVEAGRAGQEDL